MEWAAAMQAIRPVDGVRGTWSWMLQEGNHGYGLVPWISNPMWWDQFDQIYEVAPQIDGRPIFTPGIVEWHSPVNNDMWETVVDTSVPNLAVSACALLGTDIFESGATGTLGLNMVNYWESRAMEYSWFGLPVWQVTPIDEDTAHKWSDWFYTHWNQYPELLELPHLSGWGPSHRHVEVDGDEVLCDADSGQECICGVEWEWDALDSRSQQGWYFPAERITNDPNPDPFWTVWDWGLDRYIRATAAIHELVAAEGENYPCLSSWVLSQSPFLATQPSNAWTWIAEGKSSDLSMSSQLFLDFSTAV